MDTPEDIRREKFLLWKEEQKIAMQDQCEKCSEHNENCEFYDPENECWDWEECFEVMGE